MIVTDLAVSAVGVPLDRVAQQLVKCGIVEVKDGVFHLVIVKLLQHLEINSL